MPSRPVALQAPSVDGVPDVASAKAPPSLTIRGPRKAAAIARVVGRVAWLALRTYRNPFRAARALGRLAAAQRSWTDTMPGSTRAWISRRCVRASGRLFWDLYVPGFPSAAFDRTIAQELNRVDPIGRPRGLQTAIVAITRRCSLKCEHCFEGDALNHPEALSAIDLREIVERVQQLGAAQVFFSGGEPLQRFGDLVALAATASAGADVWVLTSGRGLTADRARRLRDAGTTGVALSLDHWDPASHDRFRGVHGSFTAVELAARNAREAGLLVALSLCPTRSFVTASNLQRYGDVARSLGASFIQIFEPRSVGRYANGDVALEPSQQRILEAFCDRLNTAARSDLPTVRYLDWTRRSVGCAGGDRYLYVDTGGDMHACPFCREHGVSVLDQDTNAAFAILKTAGCAAGGSHCHSMTGASL